MSKNIEALDKNFVVATEIKEPDIRFYSAKDKPFAIYGLYNCLEEPVFKRMPTEIAEKVNSGVATLHLHTSGGRLRFATDSRYVAINAKMPSFSRAPHNALTGTSSFDLYIDDPNGAPSRFFKPFIPPYDMKDGYESLVDLKTNKMRYITINFPSYAQVSELYIGLQKNAELSEGLKYRDIKPIVYYGSSITQGACTLRPGNIYQNIICRRNNIDYVNLGFSGSAKAEDIMVDYLRELDMSIFVLDYDHNAPNPEHLKNTHRRLYERFREVKPNVPFVMISKADVYKNYEDALLRRDVIMATYLYARSAGDQNVYFVDGMRIYPDAQYESCTVDHVHPTDLGMSFMADAIGTELNRILTRDNL